MTQRNPWTGFEEGLCKQGKPGQMQNTEKEKVMNFLFNRLC